MQKLFTKILVPVAFNRNTRWSVDKAIQLANKFDCDVLLLHVQLPPVSLPFVYAAIFSGTFSTFSAEETRAKMKQLECQVKPRLNPGLLLTSVTKAGYWQSVLKDVIISDHIDLTVIPKSRRRFSSALIQRININKLSLQTNCPVLTVTRGFNANHLHSIVVPINNHLPVKKLSLATYLSLETSGQIYLMGEENDTANKENSYLLKAYQLLSEFGKLNIQCALGGDQYDPAAGALRYAKKINADLIVINTGKESRLKGWWNRLRGKYLSRESNIPVLTVSFN